ncbi:MAG: tail fiber domain-containing protein [Xanthomonadales bacterium]|nr:tail fiber domain-containing protein [Xanthomonadales bacterium]
MRAQTMSLAIALLVLPIDQTLAQDGSVYRWERPQGAAGATLTLRGGDGDKQISFSADQSVLVSAADLNSGAYRWELVFAPVSSGDLAKSVSAQRKAGDTSLPKDWPQSVPVRNGLLQVNAGRFVSPLIEEEVGQKAEGAAAAKAAPITGSVSIRPSACVGNDCADNESFGFSTILLKENNLRILFDDTSAAPFPANDWQLTANDNLSGGPSFFAIDDVSGGRRPFLIEAGAINNALYVDSNGDVGIGTDAPVVELHAVDGNTPTLRLEQNGSNGFSPYVWDVAGNEAGFFVRDVTNASRLPFRIEPGASTSSIHINDDSSIGMGVASPTAALHIRRNVATSFLLVEATPGDRRMELDNNGNLYVGGTITQLSSRYSKENLVAVAGSALLDQLRSLDLWTWNYISAPDADRHIGPVAEDFYAAFGLGTDDKSLAPGDVAGVALAASQALSEQIAQRDAKIATLEERIARLEAALEQISSAQR